MLEVTSKNTNKPGHNWDETFPNIVGNGTVASIGVKLATLAHDTLGVLTKLHGEETSGVLIEFHGLILATFTPVLSNLQAVLRSGDLSLRRWIVPTEEAGQVSAVIPLPMYARRPGFCFKLDPLIRGGVLSRSVPRKEALGTLEKGTTLDHAQCEALYAALTREYALVQGPPGTGKSYVGVQIVRVSATDGRCADLGGAQGLFAGREKAHLSADEAR